MDKRPINSKEFYSLFTSTIEIDNYRIKDHFKKDAVTKRTATTSSSSEENEIRRIKDFYISFSKLFSPRPDNHNSFPRAFKYFSENYKGDAAAQLISFVYTYAFGLGENDIIELSENINQYYEGEERDPFFLVDKARELKWPWIYNPSFVIRCIYTVNYLKSCKNYYPYSYCLAHPNAPFKSNFQFEYCDDGINFFKPKEDATSITGSAKADDIISDTEESPVESESITSNCKKEIDLSNLTKKLNHHFSENSIFSKLIICSEIDSEYRYTYFINEFLSGISLSASRADVMSVETFTEKSDKSSNPQKIAVKFMKNIIKNYFFILDTTCRTDDFINNALCFYKLESSLGIMSFCAYLENSHEAIPHKVDLFDDTFLQLNTNADVYSYERYNLPISKGENPVDEYPDYTDCYKYNLALMYKLNEKKLTDVCDELIRTACFHYDLFAIDSNYLKGHFFTFKEMSLQLPRSNKSDVAYIQGILYYIRKGYYGEEYQNYIYSILDILRSNQKEQLFKYIKKRYEP